MGLLLKYIYYEYTQLTNGTFIFGFIGVGINKYFRTKIVIFNTSSRLLYFYAVLSCILGICF